jgi:thioredoxin-dependent peroxiredoxin
MIAKGKKAPSFKSIDQNGATIQLKDFIGKKVVLYFYPKDDTPGCTAQACNLRDNISLLQQNDMVVLGVSVDDVKKHKKFEAKYDLPFTLIADTEKTIVASYKVWGEKKFMGKTYMGTNRVTYLINEKGLIDEVIDKVDTANHTQQILELWNMETPIAVQVQNNKATKKATVKAKVPVKAAKKVEKKVVAKAITVPLVKAPVKKAAAIKVPLKKVAVKKVASKTAVKPAAKPAAKKVMAKKEAQNKTVVKKNLAPASTKKEAVKKSK